MCKKIEVFDAMLRGSFSEATSKVIDLPEDNFYAFELLVEWCYTDRISMPDKTSSYKAMGVRVELYCLAHKYLALVLQDFATNYIIFWLKMNDHLKKIIDPDWFKRIEEVSTATWDELSGFCAMPGPYPFLVKFVNQMNWLARKPKASQLAIDRIASFDSEKLSECWQRMSVGLSNPKDIESILKLPEKEAAEFFRLKTDVSTSCCERHTHRATTMLQCPVFKEVKGSAKFSPDALVIIAHLKRVDRLTREILSEIGGPLPWEHNYIVHTNQLIGRNGSYKDLRDEINANGQPLTHWQACAGMAELEFMGVFINDTRDSSKKRIRTGMGIASV